MKKKIKKLVTLTLILTMALPISLFAEAGGTGPTRSFTDTIYVNINDSEINFANYGVQPVIKDGRTLVPLKAVSQELGAIVTYDDKFKKITVVRDSNRIIMTLGNKQAVMTVGGKLKVVEMETAPVIIDGRSFVPIKYIGDAFNAYVDWDQNARFVSIVDAQKFYNDLKSDKNIDTISVMDRVISDFKKNSIVYQNNLMEMRSKMERDMSSSFTAYSYYGKFIELSREARKNEIITLQSQLSTSSISVSQKAELTSLVDLWLKEFDSKIEGYCGLLVSITETSMSPADYKTANNALGYLPYSVNKQLLLARMAKISTQIQITERYQDAEAKIQAYVSNPTRANLDIAKNYVNNLPSGIEKTAMSNRVKGYESNMNEAEAQTYVQIAELSKKIDDYLLAEVKVKALYSSDAKSSLTKRLSAVETSIYEILTVDATNMVYLAESYKTASSYDAAKVLVDKMKSSSTKSALTTRLDLLKIIVGSEALVAKAEATKNQDDVISATKHIASYVKDETLKASYSVRLVRVQEIIDAAILDAATKAVIKAELSAVKPDYLVAVEKVKVLKSSAAKTALENRLSALLPLIKENYTAYVKTLVDYAVANPTLANYTAAFNANKDVTDSAKKAEYSAALAGVYSLIMQNQVTEISKLVLKAETTLLQSDLDIARVEVNKLASGPDKEALTEALNLLQIKINTK